MKKIKSLFARNYETDRLVRDEIVEGSEWVISGEGVATRKFDGTCCMIQDGTFYKRYEVKNGKKAPAGFLPADEVDEVTGKQQGWVKVIDDPSDKYHVEAFSIGLSFADESESNPEELKDGTYELIGLKIQGNPEHAKRHILIRHGADVLEDAPRDFEGLKLYLEHKGIEGIVWHRENGDMVKVKRKDFFKR